MLKSLKFLFSFAVIALLFTACSKDESNASSVENYAEATTTFLQERSGCGFGGCFELVFPISVTLADGTVITADSSAALKTAIKNWRVDNPDVKGKPEFVFPISVVKADGTVVAIASVAELMALRKECPRQFGKGHGKGKHCFMLTFPFSIKQADGTVVVVNGPEDIKKQRNGEKDHKMGDKKPELVFPVTVKLKDGTTQVVNSKEELTALKDSCK